jgi:hypothetical protein
MGRPPLGCCARAASGHAAALPSSVMNFRRLVSNMGFPPGRRHHNRLASARAVASPYVQPAAERSASPWARPESFLMEVEASRLPHHARAVSRAEERDALGPPADRHPIPTCCGIQPGSSWPIRAWILGRCNTTSATRTSSTRYDIPNLLPIGSAISGRTKDLRLRRGAITILSDGREDPLPEHQLSSKPQGRTREITNDNASLLY